MGMAGAIASVRHQVTVVLQHVQVIVPDHAIDLTLGPLFCFGNSNVDGLSLKWLRLPIGGNIGNHPIANLGIARIQSSRPRRESSLSPVHPDAEFQSVLVRLIREYCPTPPGPFRGWV